MNVNAGDGFRNDVRRRETRVMRQRQVECSDSTAGDGGFRLAGQREDRLAGWLGRHLDVGPVHAIRPTERLDQRLFRGIARSQRVRLQGSLCRCEQAGQQRGRAFDRALEAGDIDQIDADSDDHGTLPSRHEYGLGQTIATAHLVIRVAKRGHAVAAWRRSAARGQRDQWAPLPRSGAAGSGRCSDVRKVARPPR